MFCRFTQIEYINGTWKTKLISLPYDIDLLLQEFDSSGVYAKYRWWAKLLIKCLQTGINYPVKGLVRAFEIANCNNESLNENHWKQASNELGLE